MVKRERKFYSEEFKERVLTSYYNSNESVSTVASRFAVSRDTVGSWVYRTRTVPASKKRVKLAPSETDFMKREEKRRVVTGGESSTYSGIGGSACQRKNAVGMFGKDDRDSRTGVKNRHQKKIWCQTVHGMRQESSSYRIEALCRLFGKSRQAYYERSHYVAGISVEEDTILFLVREVAYSHKIVGWNLSRTLRTSGAPAALNSRKGKHPELIHHSDRGSQYCCRDYVSLPTGKSIRHSYRQNHRFVQLSEAAPKYRLHGSGAGTSNRHENGTDVEKLLSKPECTSGQQHGRR